MKHEPGFDDKILPEYMRVERDHKVRLTPVWFMYVEPLTTGTELLLRVFKSPQ